MADTAMMNKPIGDDCGTLAESNIKLFRSQECCDVWFTFHREETEEPHTQREETPGDSAVDSEDIASREDGRDSQEKEAPGRKEGEAPGTNGKVEESSISNGTKTPITNLINAEMQENRRFRLGAHRFALMSRSPVFRAMLEERWLKLEQEPINIPDIDKEVFREFLQFLYADTCDVTSDTVSQLMYAASKYMVPRFYNSTAFLSYIDQNLSLENVCMFMELASKFLVKDLVQSCLDFVAVHAKELFATEAFLRLSSENLGAILDLQALGCLDEEGIFKRCIKWAEKQCVDKGLPTTEANYRPILRYLLPKIRFLSMKPAQCAELLHRSNLMSVEDKADLFGSLLMKQAEKEPIFLLSKFNRYPRIYKSQVWAWLKGSELEEPCYDSISSEVNTIFFKVDSPVVIFGVGINQRKFQDKLKKTLTLKVVGSDTFLTQLSTSGEDDIQKIRPVRLRMNVTYQLILQNTKLKAGVEAALKPSQPTARDPALPLTSFGGFTNRNTSSLFGSSSVQLGFGGFNQVDQNFCSRCGNQLNKPTIDPSIAPCDAHFTYDTSYEKCCMIQMSRGIFQRFHYIRL